MGGGKPKTGIKVVDDGIDSVSNIGNDVSNGVKSVVSTVSNTGNRLMQDTTDTIRDAAAGAYKNVERNAQNVTKGLAMAASGNFNNLDRTLLDLSMMGVTGGIYNPDDATQLLGKQTAVERKTEEVIAEANANTARDAAVAQADTMNDISNVISGQVGARMRSPGRDMTLLTGGAGKSNTLLTLMGK